MSPDKFGESVENFVKLLKQIRPMRRQTPTKKGGRGYTKPLHPRKKKKKRSSKRTRLARHRGLHPRKPRKRDR